MSLVVLIVRYETEAGGFAEMRSAPLYAEDAAREEARYRALGYEVRRHRATDAELGQLVERCPGCNGGCGGVCARRG